MMGLVGSALAVKKISKILKIPENKAGQYISLINKIKEVIRKEVDKIERFKKAIELPDRDQQQVSASPVSKEQYFATIFSEIETGESKYDDITDDESLEVALNILSNGAVMDEIADKAKTDIFQTRQKDVGLLHKGGQLLEEKHFKTLLESEAHRDSDFTPAMDAEMRFKEMILTGNHFTRLTDPWMKKIWEKLLEDHGKTRNIVRQLRVKGVLRSHQYVNPYTKKKKPKVQEQKEGDEDTDPFDFDFDFDSHNLFDENQNSQPDSSKI